MYLNRALKIMCLWWKERMNKYVSINPDSWRGGFNWKVKPRKSRNFYAWVRLQAVKGDDTLMYDSQNKKIIRDDETVRGQSRVHFF